MNISETHKNRTFYEKTILLSTANVALNIRFTDSFTFTACESTPREFLRCLAVLSAELKQPLFN
jgi:hypothetical protein